MKILEKNEVVVVFLLFPYVTISMFDLFDLYVGLCLITLSTIDHSLIDLQDCRY